jgi:hypothetical protein
MTDPTRCPSCGALLRRCPRCGETKPADQFTKSKRSATHLSTWCRGCQREHREDPERKARQRESNRAANARRTQRKRDERSQSNRSLEERLAALERAVEQPDE